MIARRGARRQTWHLRHRLARARGRFEAISFRVSRARIGAGETYRATRAVAVPILGSVLVALVVVAALWVLDDWIDHGWTISDSSYDALFEALAGVSGVFLALYFTAVSTVASTAYADVPSEVRDLLVRDKLSNSYVRIVAFLAALSIAFLGLRALGYPPLGLAVWVAVVAAALAIFAFVVLGLRAFQFFDPVALAHLALRDVVSDVRRVVTFGRPASSQTIREARSAVHDAIRAVTSLVSLAGGQRRFQGRGVPDVLRQVAYAARAYALMKGGIPTHGGWFGTRYRHRRWYLSDFRAGLETATHAFVSLQPEEVPDVDWVEEAFLQPIESTVTDLLHQGDLEAVWLVEPALLEYVSVRAAVFDVHATSAWVERMSEALVSAAVGTESPTSREVAVRAAATEWVGRALIELEVAVYRRIESLNVASLDAALLAADHAHPGTPARLSSAWGLPRSVTEVLERVQSGREFEEIAAVGVATPSWYARDLTVHALRWAIHGHWHNAFESSLRLFPLVVDKLHSQGRPIEAATLCSAAVEAAWKFRRHVPVIQERDEELRRLLVLTDLREPSWQWEALGERAERFQLDMLTRLSRLIPDLAAVEDVETLPDFLGQAVHFTGEACFAAVADCRPDRFARLFPAYFFGILGIAERVREEVVSWLPDQGAPWIAAPVIDLLSMCGYAMIYSELHGDRSLWTPCLDVWTRYLSDESRQRLAFLDAAVATERNTFALHPRGVLRTSWRMRLERDLRALPRRSTTHIFEDGEIDHPSALVRLLMPTSWHLAYDALDVFVAVYLQAQTDAEGLSFGARGTRVDHFDRLRELAPLFQAPASHTTSDESGEQEARASSSENASE